MSNKSKGKMLSYAETAAFCSQMEMILKAGVSALEGIHIMKEDAVSEEEKQILEQMNETMMETGSLYDAIESTGVFPEYMIKLTELGERSGRLDEVMEELALYYNREDTLVANIRSAITYPIIMSAMMLALILLLIVKVLPIFQQVFHQLGSELTGVSGALMNLGIVLNRYSVILIMLLIMAVVLFFVFSRLESGKKMLQNVSAKIPFARKIREKTAVCRFAGGMSLALKSGLPVTESIQMAANLADHPVIQKKIEDCLHYMEESEEFHDALLKSGLFSGIYARMVNVASRTGGVDEIMEEVAARYQDEINDELSSKISIIEPTLVATLSIVTGFILLSIMLPIMAILSGI